MPEVRKRTATIVTIAKAKSMGNGGGMTTAGEQYRIPDLQTGKYPTSPLWDAGGAGAIGTPHSVFYFNGNKIICLPDRS